MRSEFIILADLTAHLTGLVPVPLIWICTTSCVFFTTFSDLTTKAVSNGICTTPCEKATALRTSFAPNALSLNETTSAWAINTGVWYFSGLR